MSVEELKNLIVKYELALRAMEDAHSHAACDENCGRGGRYLTQQEQAEEVGFRAAEEVRADAAKLGIELPTAPMVEYPYNKENPHYKERMERHARWIKDRERPPKATENDQ